MQIRRVLITGGAGFIGSHVVEAMAGVETIVLDDLRTGLEENLANLGARLVRGSVTDPRLLRGLCAEVDAVVHLASMVGVPESMEDPVECVQVNVQGTLCVLEAARKAGVRRVVFASSAAVYGDAEGGARREDERPEPLSPYGITKLDGELYMDMYRREYGLSTVSLRFFNVYGPRQSPRSGYAAVVPLFVRKALAGEDLEVCGDGEQTRDFVFVRDVARATRLAAERPDVEGVHNVARGHSISVNELGRTVIALAGSSSRLRHSEARAGDIRHSTADVSRLRAAGFVADTSLEDGLRETIEWMSPSEAGACPLPRGK